MGKFQPLTVAGVEDAMSRPIVVASRSSIGPGARPTRRLELFPASFLFALTVGDTVVWSGRSVEKAVAAYNDETFQ